MTPPEGGHRGRGQGVGRRTEGGANCVGPEVHPGRLHPQGGCLALSGCNCKSIVINSSHNALKRN
eukprot:4884714-Pyramimonas_sp.AAC.1